MIDITAAASHPSAPIDDITINGIQALQTGFKLARASQLTMLRLQLALHESNRPIAMEALDILLEIDSEMEGVAATLADTPQHGADDAALSEFIGFQKVAIAAEKHALTGGYHRKQARSVVIPAPCIEGDVGPSERSLFLDDEMENRPRAKGAIWIVALVFAIVATIFGFGLLAYFWPASAFAEFTRLAHK